MALETFTYITSLDAANPASSDNASVGDDHIRGIKTVLTASFPAVAGAVTATHTELNYVDGVTSNIQTQLDGKLSTSLTQSVKTADFNVSAGNHYILRTNSSLTATFPASATSGDWFWITNTSGGNWTGARNGLKIMGGTSDDTLANGSHYEYVYVDSTTGWARIKSS